MNEDGGKLIAFLIIGVVLILFIASLSIIFKPSGKIILPPSCDDIYSSCLDGCNDGDLLFCKIECNKNYEECKKVEVEKVKEVDSPSDDEEEKEDEKEKESDTDTTTPKEKVTYDNKLLELLYDLAIPFALLFSYLIVALAFMASKVFSSREVETWAKIELREVLISTVYALLIISFFPFFNILIDEFSQTYNGVPHEEMFVKLIDTSFKPIDSTIRYLFTFSTLNWIGWTPSANSGVLTFVPPVPPLSSPSAVIINYSYIYDGKSYLNFFSLFAHTFIPIVFSAMVSIMGQIVLLNFFEKTLFIFVGLALALRSFTFTRKMGGTLLAVILGIFFLFKLLLVIESSIFISMGLDQNLELEGSSSLNFLDTISKGISLLMSGLLSLLDVINFPMYFYSFVKDCMGGNYLLMIVCILIAPIIWLIDLIIAIGQLIAGLITWSLSIFFVSLMGVVTLTDAVNYLIVGSIALYSDLLVFGFFMPILNVIIIIAGIRCLAETFGGDVSIVNMLTFI